MSSFRIDLYNKKGNIYEWDYRHAEMEIYTKQGKHEGSYNLETKELKPAVNGRRIKK